MVGHVMWVLVGIPLHYLYMHGPSWIGWEGRKHEDICQELTNIPSVFWSNNMDQCYDTIDRKFKSMYSLFQIGLYCIVIYKIISALYFKYTVTNTLDTYFQRLTELSTYSHTCYTHGSYSYPRRRTLTEPYSPEHRCHRTRRKH